jgi:hypothetical protein
MKPSKALEAHRDELRRLVSRYDVAHPRVYGSALTGKDDEDATTPSAEALECETANRIHKQAPLC